MHYLCCPVFYVTFYISTMLSCLPSVWSQTLDTDLEFNVCLFYIHVRIRESMQSIFLRD